MAIYDDLGVTPVINADTTRTALGGTLMPPEVLTAMEEAAGAFVDMHALHVAAGHELSRLTRNEAAYVTSGCGAAIVLAVLACRTRGDLRTIAALPDAPEAPFEVVMHTAHRMPYDQAVTMAGGRIRNVGNMMQTFDWELDAALNANTAAVLWVAAPHFPKGLSLPETVRIAHARNVPVIVDAAAQLPPVDNLWNFTQRDGADLVLFSGGKALHGPQASGLILGKRDLVAAARANGAPYQRYARPLKAGKEEIAGLVAAVRRYVGLDHAALDRDWRATCESWISDLRGIAGIQPELDPHNEAGQPLPRVRVRIDAKRLQKDAGQIAAELLAGTPRIAVLYAGDPEVYLSPDLLQPGEAAIVTRRMREVCVPTSAPHLPEHH